MNEAKKESKTRWITGKVTSVTPTKDGKSVCAVFDTEVAKKNPAKEGAKPNYSFSVFFPADKKEALEAAKGKKMQVKAYENVGKEDKSPKFNVPAALASSFGPAKAKAPAKDAGPAM